jgi:addiction module HigA family antidote
MLRLWIIIEGGGVMSRPPIHPGEILADELAEIGVKPADLARQIGVPPNRISEIIRGRRGITGDTALRLGHWFGSAPQFWLNLQTAYDLRVAAGLVGAAVEKLPRRLDALAPEGRAVPEPV